MVKIRQDRADRRRLMQEGGGERVKTAGRELTEGRGESVSAVING